MVTKKQPASKKTTAAKTSKRKIDASIIYKEANPEKHVICGKFKFFYVLFACTTLFFAALSVWLYFFSSDVLNKYQSIDACARAHTSCNVRIDGDNLNVEGSDN